MVMDQEEVWVSFQLVNDKAESIWRQGCSTSIAWKMFNAMFFVTENA